MPRSIQVLWTAYSGRVWDLTDLKSPVQLVSLDGLGMPTFTQQFAVSGARDGRRYEGTNYGQATPTMTVSVGDIMPLPGRKRRRTGTEWRGMDRDWRRAVHPEKLGKLTIVTETTRRNLQLRLDQPTFIPPVADPAIIGEATYVHPLTADDQPWWEGEELPATFINGVASRGFFTGGSGAKLYISESNRVGAATITNIGDRDVYPKWWARGPFTSATVGVGDQLVTIPFPRGENQYVYIDSGRETIVDDNGVSLWPLMGFADPTFAAIQPGESVKLVTVLENGSSATSDKLGSGIGLSIVPLFEGPW